MMMRPLARAQIAHRLVLHLQPVQLHHPQKLLTHAPNLSLLQLHPPATYVTTPPPQYASLLRKRLSIASIASITSIKSTTDHKNINPNGDCAKNTPPTCEPLGLNHLSTLNGPQRHQLRREPPMNCAPRRLIAVALRQKCDQRSESHGQAVHKSRLRVVQAHFPFAHAVNIIRRPDLFPRHQPAFDQTGATPQNPEIGRAHV